MAASSHGRILLTGAAALLLVGCGEAEPIGESAGGAAGSATSSAGGDAPQRERTGGAAAVDGTDDAGGGGTAGTSGRTVVTPATGGSTNAGGSAVSAGGRPTNTGGSSASTGGSTASTGGRIVDTGGQTGGATGDICDLQNLMGADGFVVDLATGIVGPWYTFGGDGAEFVPGEEEPVVAVDGEICFSGTNTMVSDIPEFATNYGAMLALNLCTMPGQEGMEDCSAWLPPEYCEQGWEADSKHTISECGITVNRVSFDLSGTLPDLYEPLRVTFWELDRDESTYVVISNHTPGSTSQHLVSTSIATVGYDPAAPPIDVSQLAGIHFHVPSMMGEAIAWDFCISNICIE